VPSLAGVLVIVVVVIVVVVIVVVVLEAFPGKAWEAPASASLDCASLLPLLWSLA
jgi:hypothetical protein